VAELLREQDLILLVTDDGVVDGERDTKNFNCYLLVTDDGVVDGEGWHITYEVII
jgi:hypothetical protein